MMVGLPESSREDEINTAKALIKLKPKIIRIYPVLVIKGTKLEKDYLEEKYKPLTVTQAVETCKELLSMFNKRKIDVIRIGLQSTDEISMPGKENSEVVAGPYHPAFRQLVESELWYDTIVNKVKKLSVKVKEIEIMVNPKDINNVVGHKKVNKNKLKELYNVDVVIRQNKKIKEGKIKINITKKYKAFLNEQDKVKINV